MKKLTEGKNSKKRSSKRGIGLFGAVSLPLVFAFLACGCSEYTALLHSGRAFMTRDYIPGADRYEEKYKMCNP